VPYAAALLLSRRLDRLAVSRSAAGADDALASVTAAAMAWLAAETAAGSAPDELEPARDALRAALARHTAAARVPCPTATTLWARARRSHRRIP
jgi:hypothetical protein